MSHFIALDLKAILESHKKWLRGEDGGERANLMDADLMGADLMGANLMGADLMGTDLRRTNLIDANLRNANLRNANLIDADLMGANLRRTNLIDANLRNANLRNANLMDADLMGANLRRTNLMGTAGNRREIRSLFMSETYPITYTSLYLQIGCERHSISAWWEFDDERICRMDSNKALNFWKENKEFIKSAIEKFPATPTKHEEDK